MATRAANKRLIREYKNISENPPPFIQAHPSEHNILEWHYLLTGPPNTPYHNGQYWGTLVFPPDYPFKPPAIRMLTPSGRFQTNTRLCLSISDFHPKSFNPAWEVSTILIGLLSFMTSEEMTTGSISMGENERKILASRSRWWNSTGGGTCSDRGYADLDDGGGGWKSYVGTTAGSRSAGASNVIKTGDGGARFRAEFPEVDVENWKWMRERRMHVLSGIPLPIEGGTATGVNGDQGQMAPVHQRQQQQGVQEGSAVRKRQIMAANSVAATGASGAAGTAEAVVKGGESWLRRHKFLCAVVLLCGYVLLARLYE